MLQLSARNTIGSTARKIKPNEAFTPAVRYIGADADIRASPVGNWRMVCGQEFWDNFHGAEAVCRLAGLHLHSKGYTGQQETLEGSGTMRVAEKKKSL